MSRFVVDASVAIKWFLPEIHSEVAIRLLSEEHTLLAPDLLWAEAGNILWKRWRRNEITDEAALSILQDLRQLPLLIHSSEELTETAWKIASGQQRSFYDSLYLALSAHQSCPLVTADLKLFNALRDSGLDLLWVEDAPDSVPA